MRYEHLQKQYDELLHQLQDRVDHQRTELFAESQNLKTVLGTPAEHALAETRERIAVNKKFSQYLLNMKNAAEHLQGCMNTVNGFDVAAEILREQTKARGKSFREQFDSEEAAERKGIEKLEDERQNESKEFDL